MNVVNVVDNGLGLDMSDSQHFQLRSNEIEGLIHFPLFLKFFQTYREETLHQQYMYFRTVVNMHSFVFSELFESIQP